MQSVSLSSPLGIFTFVCALIALISSLLMLIKLVISKQSKRLYLLMMFICIMNLTWHGIGIYRTFLDYSKITILNIHFWTGCLIVLLDFYSHWEILKMFECITNYSTTKINYWQLYSTLFFMVLCIGSILHEFIQSELIQIWATYWLIVWFLYCVAVVGYIQSFITIKMYQSMTFVQQRQRKLKKEYLFLLLDNLALSVWNIITGCFWAYGWLIETEIERRLCFLKIGEVSVTIHLLMTLLFLERIKKFKFGDRKIALVPVLGDQTRINQ